MTTDETPADTVDNEVIEQAAKVMRPLVDTIYGCAIDGGYMPPDQGETWMPVADRIARALHDAGLLADPADRDERRNEAYRAQLARADRAEAEVAELRATVDRVRALADRMESEGINCACGHDIGGEHNSLGCYARISYQPLVTCPCTRDCDQSEAEMAAGMIRAALDGAGEQ